MIDLKTAVVPSMIAAGGEIHHIAGQGSVLVKFSTGELKRISDVLFVPGICRNLLSVGCLSEQGYYLDFYNRACIIHNNVTRQLLGKATRLGKKGLYQLPALSLSNTTICSLSKSKLTKKVLLWIYRKDDFDI